MKWEIDRFIEAKIVLTGSPDGYLKRKKKGVNRSAPFRVAAFFR